MRIEINGGIGSVRGFQGNLLNLQRSISNTIDSLRSVKNRTYNVSGGVNANLSNALDSIQSRINTEEDRRLSVENVRRQNNNFLSTTMSIDNRVASMIAQNQERFFQTNPRLRPPAPISAPAKKNWWQKLVGGAKSIFQPVGNVLKSAWRGIVDFTKKHWKKIVIGLAVVTVGALLTALTGGAFLPALLAGLKVAAISGVISGSISAAISMTSSLIKGESIGDAFKSSISAFGDGLATGFMVGGIMAGGSQVLSGIMKGSARLFGVTPLNVGKVKIWSPNSLTNPNSGGTLIKFGKTFRLDVEAGNQLFHTHIPKSLYAKFPSFVKNLKFIFDPGRRDVHVRLIPIIAPIFGVAR